MKLSKVFELGHHVARDGKGRRAVTVRGMKLWRDGFYVVQRDSLHALAQLGQPGPNDLESELPADDARTDWNPEFEFCWCEACARTRRQWNTMTD